MTTSSVDVPAEPSAFPLHRRRTALIVIDMQRDFLLPGGFGESLGNDVDQLLKVRAAAGRIDRRGPRGRDPGDPHPRKATWPDLSDCPPAKLNRGAPSKRIGDPGQVRAHPDPRRVRPRHRRRAARPSTVRW